MLTALCQVHSRGNDSEYTSRNISTLSPCAAFLERLQHRDQDGRVIVERDPSSSTATTGGGWVLRFVMLNAEVHLRDMLKEIRCMILAGGTMKPFEHFQQQLFPTLPVEKLQPFECGHIIPPTSILPLTVSTSPSGMNMCFDYERRGSKERILQVGRIIVNLCNVSKDRRRLTMGLLSIL